MSEIKPAPTLYAIIAVKLLKGSLFLAMAIVAYNLSDNDLPYEYRSLLRHLGLNPERKFFSELAVQIGTISESKVLWVAAGTAAYSLFSLIEGAGLMFRVSWAGWLAIGESAFFIPIEDVELLRHPSKMLGVVLLLNIVMVWYLSQNRERLFRHSSGRSRERRTTVVRPWPCSVEKGP